jgi:tRNA pseudouridine55 synthase
MIQEYYASVPRHESHLHGLLLVDKPGLQQVVDSDSLHIRNPSRQAQQDPADTVAAADRVIPRLYTSHDIVQLVRRWSGQRRIGHTGTLDPMASGLMVLCLGQTTRLVEYYQGHDKTYLAEITFGRATDTYDAMGQTVATAPLPTLTEAVIAPALQAFQGQSLQVPPIYSALKQDGESLHRKARRGEAVTVAPRPVTMHQLDLLALTAPDRVTVRVTCSAGTYIRSLAYDLGQALGSCAHLSLLRRERVGAFTLEDALTLAKIETTATADQLAAALLPTGTALGLPEIQLDEELVARLGHGQKVLLPAAACQSIEPHERAPILAKAMDRTGNFLGIVRCLEWRHDVAAYSLWKAEKWLATQ